MFPIVGGRYNVFAVPSARMSIFEILYGDYGCLEISDTMIPEFGIEEQSQVMRGEILIYWQQYAPKHWVPAKQ